MIIYIVLQLEDFEPKRLEAFETEEKAMQLYEKVCIDEMLAEIRPEGWCQQNSIHHLEDTIAMAVDDAGSIQIVKRHT